MKYSFHTLPNFYLPLFPLLYLLYSHFHLFPLHHKLILFPQCNTPNKLPFNPPPLLAPLSPALLLARTSPFPHYILITFFFLPLFLPYLFPHFPPISHLPSVYDQNDGIMVVYLMPILMFFLLISFHTLNHH